MGIIDFFGEGSLLRGHRWKRQAKSRLRRNAQQALESSEDPKERVKAHGVIRDLKKGEGSK